MRGKVDNVDSGSRRSGISGPADIYTIINKIKRRETMEMLDENFNENPRSDRIMEIMVKIVECSRQQLELLNAHCPMSLIDLDTWKSIVPM